MKQHRVDYSLGGRCRCLDVSRGGYYAWLQRKPSRRLQRRQALDGQVKILFHQHKQRYGTERLQRKMLKENGKPYDLKTIAASLRCQGLLAKAARKIKATTSSNHNLPVFDNLLQKDFSATAPKQKWAGDITYLGTDEGWLYLAIMIDLFSRQVVGWSMSARMTANLDCDPLNTAFFRRKRPKGVRVHLDRSSQYCSYDYRQLLQQHELLGSMSAKAVVLIMPAPRVSFTRLRSRRLTASILSHVKPCDKRCLNSSKRITIRLDYIRLTVSKAR